MSMIAHIAAPGRFGGLESVVAALCRSMATRGHRVVLILIIDRQESVPPWAESLSSFGVFVEPVRLPARAYLSERRLVRGLLRKHGAEIVHTHGFRSDVVHADAVLREGIPLVSTAHGFASTRGLGLAYEWLQKRAWRRFDAVVAVSRPLVSTLEAAGVPREKIVLIRNGLTPRTDEMLPRPAARAVLGVHPDAPIIGWVGRFSEEKAPLLAIDALAHVADPRSLLCMLGDGSLLRAAQRRVRESALENRVILKGSVSDASSLFKAFDALLITSITEGTPMVALEAAMAGVPVVSTAVGGIPDLLGNDGGWLAASGDASGLGSALGVAISDREEANRRTERLRQAMESADAHGDWITQYLDLYARISC